MSSVLPSTAVVIGAGQSGLGVSYFLKRAGIDHRVLERGRVGESWRSQRWDSFRMNTPNILTVMPGGLRPGLDAEVESESKLQRLALLDHIRPALLLVGTSGRWPASFVKGQTLARALHSQRRCPLEQVLAQSGRSDYHPLLP